MILLLNITSNLFGQNNLPFGKASTINRLKSNPANISNDSLIHIQLFSIDANVAGNKMAINYIDLLKLNKQIIRDKILGTEYGSSGTGSFRILGPSISFPLGKRNVLSLTTGARILANYRNLDGRLLSEINESYRTEQNYPYYIGSDDRMITNTATWSELGLGLSRNIWSSDQHNLNIGMNILYLKAIAHSSIETHLSGGTVDLDPSYLTGTIGTIKTMTSGDWFNNPSITGLIQGKGSWSTDLGLVYEFKKNVDIPYKLKIGISISDIGKLNFTVDSIYSKEYDVTLENTRLYFNQQLQNPQFNRVSEYLDNNSYAFNKINTINKNYSINLPTSLHIFADYRFSSGFGILGEFNSSLTQQSSTKALNESYQFSLTPHIQKNSTILATPISYDEYAGFNAGLNFQWGGFSLGSRSLFTSMFNSGKQLDMHMGANISLNTKMKNNEYKYKHKKVDTPNKFSVADSTRNYLKTFISVSGIATTPNTVPFWMRSMKYGSLPLSGISTSAIGGFTKGYNPKRKNKLLDWGLGFEGRINAGYKTEAILIEGYAKARLGIFELKAGRSKDMMGLVDSTLSTGAFSVSGNALGIPKVEISIPEYTPIGFTKGLIAIKGNFAHGWMGKQRLNDNVSQVPYANTYLHQKSFYGKFGKANWKIKLYGGFNHQAMWGNEDKIYDHSLSVFETFKYVFTGTSYHPGNFPGSKIGNHLGSLDQGLEVNFKKFRFNAYHQFFYEAGALAYLDNIKDGITGLSYTNKSEKQSNRFRIEKALVEFAYSKSQGGEVDSKVRPSGTEDYYNNWLYKNGWLYQQENIGNPLFTSNKYIREDLPLDDLYFSNNRVVGFHTGFVFTYKKWNYKALFTFTNNYGTYSTSPDYISAGGTVIYNDPPYFGEVKQFFGYLEVFKLLKKRYKLTFATAFDQGDLLDNSFTGQVKITKVL